MELYPRRQLIEPPEELNVLARRVLAAAIEVHRHVGPGFVESVYEESFALELKAHGIKYQRQVRFPVLYKQRHVGESRLDFLVEEQLVVELKAVEELREVHKQQLFSYLRSGEFQLGLLINFNVPVLLRGVRRVAWSG
jgi:GxxExxY protein